MRLWALAMLALPCWLLGAGCGAPSVGVAHTALIGGTDDADDPAVVSFAVGGYPACTGTLIAPNAVLSAGHCANLLGDGIFYDVRFGPDARAPQHRVKVVEQVTHPNYTAEGKPFDLSLFRLSEDVTDVAPLPLALGPPADTEVGATLRHVGYGVQLETGGETGHKRQGSWPLAHFDDDFLYSGDAVAQTCNGDSGGPALLTRNGVEVVVGVVSDGPDCHSEGWDTRVDRASDWIASTTQSWVAPRQGCAAAPGAPVMIWLVCFALRRRRQAQALGL